MFVCFFKSRFIILKARVQANCSFRLAHLHASEIFVNSYALMNVNCIFLKQKIIPPHLKIKENLLQLIEKKKEGKKKNCCNQFAVLYALFYQSLFEINSSEIWPSESQFHLFFVMIHYLRQREFLLGQFIWSLLPAILTLIY